MHKDEDKRLGSKSGACEIKTHAFFKNINFALIRNCTPPIKPLIQRPDGIDAVNFRKMPQEKSSIDLESDDLLVAIKSDPFEEFHSSKRNKMIVHV